MSANFRRSIARFAIHRFNNTKRSTLCCNNNKPTTCRERGRIQALSPSYNIHLQNLQLRYFSDFSTRDDVNEEGQSLHASIHFILKRIPIGQISTYDLERARAFLSIASKWNNEQGATLSEKLLERIYAEQYKSNNVTVDAEMYNICMNAWIKSDIDGDSIIYNVESIMNRMEERYRLNGTLARPDKFGYNCLINAYSKSSTDSSDKVEAILEKMNALANEAASSDNELDREYELLIRPDPYTYNSIMNYYATRQNDHKAAQRCEDLLLYQSELSKDGNNNVQMDSTSFNIVLKAINNSDTGIEGAIKAETILRMMIRLYSHGHDEVKPDAISFLTVFGAYSKVVSEDASIAVDNVLSILDELEGSYIATSEDININSCYNAAADMIVKSGLVNAVERVQELMARMRNMDAVPDKYMISSLIEAYANEGSDESIRQGKELLLEMMDKPETDVEPNTVPFNILLNSILKGSSDDKIQQAEDLISSMNDIGGDARPDLATYNMIISALSRSAAPDSQQKATEYLRQMLTSYREGYDKAKPDSFVFNCIISMLSRSEEDWADNVMYRTLMAMESQQKNGNTSVISDTITYNLVIGRLSKKATKENAKKIMTLLQKMEDNKSKTIAPDIITYTSAVQLQGKVNPGKAAVIAATYLERVLSSNEKIDQIGLKTLLNALSRSNNIEHARLASKAWTRIEKEDRSILDSDLCNLVLISYRKASDTNAAEEALSFLSDRIRQYKEGNKGAVLPSVIGFGVTIASLANVNKISNAYLLIDIMSSLSKEVPTIKPDEGCYLSILNAMNSVENAAPRVLSLMKRMNNDDIEMSTKSLNTAMNLICSTTLIGDEEAKRKAIEVAFEVFHLGKEHRDSMAFALMIKVCMRLTNDEDTRNKLVEVSCQLRLFMFVTDINPYTFSISSLFSNYAQSRG